MGYDSGYSASVLRAIASLVLLSVSACWGRAQAQDAGVTGCDEVLTRGPLEVTPATNATGVTLDAPVKVRFSPGYFELPGVDPASLIELRRCGELSAVECETLGEPVAGEVQVIGDRTLYFVPAHDLSPRELYAGVVRGIDQDLGIAFRTGFSADVGPPQLGTVDTPTTAQVGPSCEAPAGGYRVDVSFEPATDDGSAGSIEYLLYLTRGGGLEAPELRRRARNFSTGLVTMAFVLSPEEAASPVCIVVHAVDGVGNVDADMEPRCFEPITGDYFEPACNAGAAGSGGWLGLLGVLLFRRRRGR